MQVLSISATGYRRRNNLLIWHNRQDFYQEVSVTNRECCQCCHSRLIGKRSGNRRQGDIHCLWSVFCVLAATPVVFFLFNMYTTSKGTSLRSAFRMWCWRGVAVFKYYLNFIKTLAVMGGEKKTTSRGSRNAALTHGARDKEKHIPTRMPVCDCWAFIGQQLSTIGQQFFSLLPFIGQ